MLSKDIRPGMKVEFYLCGRWYRGTIIARSGHFWKIADESGFPSYAIAKYIRLPKEPSDA